MCLFYVCAGILLCVCVGMQYVCVCVQVCVYVNLDGSDVMKSTVNWEHVPEVIGAHACEHVCLCVCVR